MGKLTAKTVTAAPKKQARITITIIAKATGKPLTGIPGLLMSTDEGKSFSRDLGKSDGAGRLRFNAEPGLVDIQVRHPNHAGEGMKTLPSAADTTLVFSGQLEEGKREFTVAMLQIRAQVTVAVTDSADGTPLGGVKVTRGSEGGLTDAKGNYVTTGLDMGQKHTFVLSRNGHGPEVSTAVGPVTGIVDLTGLTEVGDQKLPLKMKNQWGKVVSSNIQVAGDKFAAWFPNFAAGFVEEHVTLKTDGGIPAKTFPFGEVMRRSSSSQFTKLFDDLPKWFGPKMTLEEFVAVFMIVSNETGGTYRPLSEVGTIDYMFYLNKSPNRLAGDQLKSKGLLKDDERVVAWNAKGSKKFPGVGTDGITEADLQECDFWKYRGRGFVQTTLRPLYLDRVDPILKAAGLKASEELTANELDAAVQDNAQVYEALLKREVSVRSEMLSRANAEEWKPFGYAVAGQNSHSYVALYEWRCQELYKELRKAAESGRLVFG